MGLLQEEHEKSTFYNVISYRKYTESQFFCKISILLFDLFLIGTLKIITLAYLLKIAQRGGKSGILLFSAFSNLKAAVSADFGRSRSKSTSVVPWGSQNPQKAHRSKGSRDSSSTLWLQGTETGCMLGL